MRYTTIIDVSEFPDVYRNRNATLLYLHCCLKAGWHDADRDTLRFSFRSIAATLGMTLSAARHAVSVLTAAGLLARDEDCWRVKKWHMDALPSPRKKATTATATESAHLRQQEEQQRNEYYAKLSSVVRSMTAAQLQEWFSQLKEGKSPMHGGITIRSNAANIAWFKANIIDKLNGAPQAKTSPKGMGENS